MILHNKGNMGGLQLSYHSQLYTNTASSHNKLVFKDRQAPVQRPVSQSNLGKLAPKRLKPIWILMKQELMQRRWHQLDHVQIVCISLQTTTPVPQQSILV